MQGPRRRRPDLCLIRDALAAVSGVKDRVPTSGTVHGGRTAGGCGATQFVTHKPIEDRGCVGPTTAPVPEAGAEVRKTSLASG